MLCNGLSYSQATDRVLCDQISLQSHRKESPQKIPWQAEHARVHNESSPIKLHVT